MLLAAVLGLILAPSSADAEKVAYALSGNGLLAMCEKYEASKSNIPAEGAACVGYIQGVVDAVSVLDYRACFPETAPYEQHARIVVKYLKDHPQQLHLHRFELTISALRAAFPCNEKSK